MYYNFDLPILVVQVLPQQFYRRLRTVLLFNGHVQIVNEQHSDFTLRWAIVTPFLFVKLRNHQILGLIRTYVNGEGNESRFKTSLVDLIHQKVLNVETFTSSCGTDKKETFVVSNV